MVYKETDVMEALSEIYVDVLGSPVAERTLLRIKQAIKELPVEDVDPEELTTVRALCEDYVSAGLDARFIQACINAVQSGMSTERIAEIAKAEAEGRLIVLPCKVGDTVYWIRGKAILEVYIQWFETNAYGWCACGMYPPMSTPTFRFADFGKTVFLTREEAEAALEYFGEG